MSTSARFPGSKNTENTFVGAQIDYQTPAYAASLTINTIPNAYKTLVVVGALTGALTLNLGVGTSTTAPFVGDEIEIFFSSTPGETVTWGAGISANAATLVVAAGKKGSAKFTFDGSSWVGAGFATV